MAEMTVPDAYQPLQKYLAESRSGAMKAFADYVTFLDAYTTKVDLKNAMDAITHGQKNIGGYKTALTTLINRYEKPLFAHEAAKLGIPEAKPGANDGIIVYKEVVKTLKSLPPVVPNDLAKKPVWG